MVCFPNAKINLGLTIIEKRTDGYHNLESLFYPISLCDVLEVVENPKAAEKKDSKQVICFESTGIPISGDPLSNLCVKAYELLSKDYPMPPVKIHLHKIIPVGAGLGGGSSDAACFIKLLNDKFELGLSWGEQHHYAKQVGSDCSFFISNKPAFAKGRGDELEPANVQLSGYRLVLIYPGIFISTAEAYSKVKPKKRDKELDTVIDGLKPENWKGLVTNDFEDSVFDLHPLLSGIKKNLYAKGAVYASMSGSGSSVYGLFTEKVDLKKEYKDYFVWQEDLV